MPKTVYIVEDDADIRELVTYALANSGFFARGCDAVGGLLSLMKEKIPDIILLDIMLPGRDGVSILKQLREDPSYKDIPVIMLTAKGSEFDKVMALDTGADDYVTKPFGVTELISRVRAVLRRTAKQQTDNDGSANERNILTHKDIQLDDDAHSVTANGVLIPLTYKEYELLRYMLINKGLVLTRGRIMDAVWGVDFEGQSRTVDMHIKTLRQKLGADGACITTIRNVGYKLGD